LFPDIDIFSRNIDEVYIAYTIIHSCSEVKGKIILVQWNNS